MSIRDLIVANVTHNAPRGQEVIVIASDALPMIMQYASTL